MVPEFVDRTGGSNRVQAQPAGSEWPSALPTRLSLPDKLRWGSGGARSGSGASPSGGAEAMPTENPQEIPADSQTSAASAYGGRWSSIEPAAASGRRPCRPGSACYLPTQKLAKISDTTASDASSPVISPSSRRASHSSTAATSSGTPVSMACTARARAA